MSTPRRLLTRLRETLTHGVVSLGELVTLVGAELPVEVCSIYAMRPGDILQLVATEGLRQAAVGHTRLRVGEGIVGLCAATGTLLNLPDAQNHPQFAYRPETGEEPFASLLALPVRRAGRTYGVLAVQSTMPRVFNHEELDILQTVAMLLADVLAAHGAIDGAEEGIASSLPRTFTGSQLVPGIVIGPVALHSARAFPRHVLAEDPEAELRRLHDAADRMQQSLDDLIAARMPPGFAEGPEAAASRDVLDAYRLIAADDGWLRKVGAVIESGLSAEAAVQRVAGDLRDRMRRIADPYLRERLADLEDLAGRLLDTLTGAGPTLDVPPGAVLIARRLGPAELLSWHARGIAAVAIEEASPAGHAAILARALGLPMLGGMRDLADATEAGDEVVLDADGGVLILRPEADVRETYRLALEARSEQQESWAALRDRPAQTADGEPIRLMLNVGLSLELDQLETTQAEGIGLFRTEIAMLARGTVTDTAEQAAVYARVMDAAAGRPVMFRTLDLGADKLLPGMSVEEENPALGWRSIRIALDRPALLRRQARALLLASGGRPLSVMFPMIATVAEFRAARAVLLAEAERVRPAPAELSIGAMLEVPSLMWQLPALLREADFISVGSNDLMQFLFAADRGTPALSNRYDVLSPPVFDLVEELLRHAKAAGVPVSICGEAASRPIEALALVGLGVTTLSMSAAGILPVKAMLAALDVRAFRTVLETLRRNAGGAASLREPIVNWAREHGLPV